MSNNDFIIENGVLTKYIGKDKDIVIPDCVTEIGEEAFIYSNVQNVIIPGSVKKIRRSAFESSNLKSVVIQNGTTEIDACAFMECVYLVNITLPSSINSIGYKAFLTHYVVYGLKEKRTIYAPAGSYAEQYAKDEHILFCAG